MNEVQRLQYLDAINIVSYIPHRALPGALPSTLCDWPEGTPVFSQPAALLKQENQQVPSPEVDGKKVFARLQENLDGASVHKTAAAEAIDATTVTLKTNTQAQAVAGSFVQFQFTIFQPRDGLLVLVPAQDMGKVHSQLLKNILFAIGIKNNELVPLDNFRWPPQAQAHQKMNSNLSAAQETLHALLEGYQLKQRIRQVCLFDQQLGERLFEGSNLVGMDILVLPSLQSMLEEPIHKKACWQLIRPLKQ